MKIMKNEPIMRLVKKFESARRMIEQFIYLLFALCIAVAVSVDLLNGLMAWNTLIALICPIPIFFLSRVSASLYRKMHPDKEIGDLGTIPAMYHIFATGAKSQKKAEKNMAKKFAAVVFKLRLSVGES